MLTIYSGGQGSPAAHATGTGGTGSYTYQWSSSSSGASFYTTSALSSISNTIANPYIPMPTVFPSSNTYTVTVTDANTGCTASSTASVTSGPYMQIMDGTYASNNVGPRVVSDMVSDNLGSFYAVGRMYDDMYFQHNPDILRTLPTYKDAFFIAKYTPCNGTTTLDWDWESSTLNLADCYPFPSPTYPTPTYTPYDDLCTHPYNSNVAIGLSGKVVSCSSGLINYAVNDQRPYSFITIIDPSTQTSTVASPLLASYQLPEYIITTDIESDPDGNIYIAGYNADAFAHLLNSTWIYPQNDFIAKISYSSGLVFDWVYVPFNSAKTLNYDYLGDGALSLGTFKQGSTDYIIISSGTALDILDNTGAQTSLNHTYSINTSYTDRTNRIAVDRLNSRLYYLDNSYLPTMPLYAEINCLDFSTTSPFFSVNSARPTKIVLTTGSQQMGLSYDLKVDNTLGGTGNIYVVKGDEIISISGSSWNINGTPSWSRETFMPSTTQASASTYSRTFTDPDMSALDRCLTFDDNLVSNGNIYIGGIATNINQLYLNSTLTPPFLPAVTGSSETSYGFIIRLDNANGAFYKTNSGETDIMRVDISDNPWVSIFPNPTKDQLNIAFNVLSKNATVSIYDMTGRIVIDKTMDISGGKSQAIDLSDMADGTYEVHVRSGSNVAVKKVVKIH